MVHKFLLDFDTLLHQYLNGNLKLKYHRQLLITLVSAELNNFINPTKHMRWILHLNLVIDRFKCCSEYVL